MTLLDRKSKARPTLPRYRGLVLMDIPRDLIDGCHVPQAAAMASGMQPSQWLQTREGKAQLLRRLFSQTPRGGCPPVTGGLLRCSYGPLHPLLGSSMAMALHSNNGDLSVLCCWLRDWQSVLSPARRCAEPRGYRRPPRHSPLLETGDAAPVLVNGKAFMQWKIFFCWTVEFKRNART